MRCQKCKKAWCFQKNSSERLHDAKLLLQLYENSVRRFLVSSPSITYLIIFIFCRPEVVEDILLTPCTLIQSSEWDQFLQMWSKCPAVD